MAAMVLCDIILWRHVLQCFITETSECCTCDPALGLSPGLGDIPVSHLPDLPKFLSKERKVFMYLSMACGQVHMGGMDICMQYEHVGMYMGVHVFMWRPVIKLSGVILGDHSPYFIFPPVSVSLVLRFYQLS